MIVYCFHNNNPINFTIIKNLQMIDLKFAFRSMIDRSHFDRSDRSFSRIVWPLPDKQVIDTHTDTHTHTQTQATTIPEGQNWPRVKNHTELIWSISCLLMSWQLHIVHTSLKMRCIFLFIEFQVWSQIAHLTKSPYWSGWWTVMTWGQTADNPCQNQWWPGISLMHMCVTRQRCVFPSSSLTHWPLGYFNEILDK